MILALAEINHKVMVCSPSNGAVNTIAKRVWSNRGPHNQGTKMLRLEVSSVESEIILRTDQEFSPEVNSDQLASRKSKPN